MARSSCAGCPPSAATSNAARPLLAAASRCRTVSGRRPRATSVRTPCGGTKITAEMDGSTGACCAQTSSPVRPLITNPPSSAGATLSGWPSIRLARASAARRRAGRSPSWTRPRASTMPPTMAADDEPSPRLCGIRLVQATCKPGGWRSIASNAARIERTTRCRSSSGTWSAPSPATCTSRSSARDLSDQGVAQLQGEPEAVEAGAEVGAGRRDLDGYRPVDEPLALPTPLTRGPRPRRPPRRRRHRRCRRGR